MSFPYKNPISGQQVDGEISIQRTSVQGTNYSVLGVGGYMEVYHLTDLLLNFSGTGLQQLSSNIIPINLTIGTNNTFNPTFITLNSDNISSEEDWECWFMSTKQTKFINIKFQTMNLYGILLQLKQVLLPLQLEIIQPLLILAHNLEEIL